MLLVLLALSLRPTELELRDIVEDKRELFKECVTLDELLILSR